MKKVERGDLPRVASIDFNAPGQRPAGEPRNEAPDDPGERGLAGIGLSQDDRPPDPRNAEAQPAEHLDSRRFLRAWIAEGKIGDREYRWFRLGHVTPL